MTLNEQLEEILEIKNDIKTSIQGKGQTVTDFASYPDAIDDISSVTVKTDKTLIILNNQGVNTTTNYVDTDDENLNGVTETYYVSTFEAPTDASNNYSVHSNVSVTSVINNNDESVEIYNGGTLLTTESSMAAAWNYIYGQGTYVTTDESGMLLVNLVNTLSATYNLSIDEWKYETDITETVYLYIPSEEPEEPEEPDPEEEPIEE